jgi:hypothetical protein
MPIVFLSLLRRLRSRKTAGVKNFQSAAPTRVNAGSGSVAISRDREALQPIAANAGCQVTKGCRLRVAACAGMMTLALSVVIITV